MWNMYYIINVSGSPNSDSNLSKRRAVSGPCRSMEARTASVVFRLPSPLLLKYLSAKHISFSSVVSGI